MRRRAALCLVLFVLIAAAVNLPLAIRGMPAPQTPVPTDTNVFGAEAAARGWPVEPPRAWPEVTQWSESRAIGFRRRTAWSAQGSMTTHQMQLDEYGWPFPALARVQHWWPWSDPQWSTTTPPDSGLTLRWGVVVNPILAGSVAWIALVGPVLLWLALRRRSRRRHGLCPQCAYPIGNSPHCTECGVAVAGGGHAGVGGGGPS